VNRDITNTNAITTFFKAVTSSRIVENLLNIPQTRRLKQGRTWRNWFKQLVNKSGMRRGLVKTQESDNGKTVVFHAVFGTLV
jgi:hypothetical protein